MNYLRAKLALGIMGLVGVMTVYAGDPPISTTVEGVFQKKQDLTGKQVQIKGKVVKVNNGVMKRNFLHVQDGTGTKDTNDITVTSDQTAAVGDQVTITGNVATNVDFGAGYSYPVLIEKAMIEVNKP